MYCATGSETAKNIRSIPMPAAKSMEVHVKRPKRGLEWSGPSLMRPAEENASTMTNATITPAVRM